MIKIGINKVMLILLLAVFIPFIIIPVAFIYETDLSIYFIPKTEFYNFYLFSFIYSIFAIVLAFLLFKIHNKENLPTWLEVLKFGFGLLWIIDGVLQFQPQMPYGFLNEVILPTITSISNGGIESFLMLGYNLWKINPIQFDAISGALQIFLGVSLLINSNRKALRFTAALAIFWSLVIWIFGEGFGGIPDQGVSLLVGFPGSASIYIIGALPFFFVKYGNRTNYKVLLKYSIGSIFAIGAVLQLIPGNTYWTTGQLAFDIYMNIFNQGENPLLARMLSISSNLLLYNEAILNVFFSLLFATSSLTILYGIRKLYFLPAILTGFFWVFFQDMGIYISPATDLNTGFPLLLILLVFYILVFYEKWGASDSKRTVSELS